MATLWRISFKLLLPSLVYPNLITIQTKVNMDGTDGWRRQYYMVLKRRPQTKVPQDRLMWEGHLL